MITVIKSGIRRALSYFIPSLATREQGKRKLSESESADSNEGSHKPKRKKLEKPEERSFSFGADATGRKISLKETTRPDIKIPSFIDTVRPYENSPHPKCLDSLNKDFSIQCL
eukprot:TRINITY_DN4018_c0_g4_i3.p1 TRINITY_DN4018_c0_g4~~TRINITY_DN4018_c0_g4_i3.p1  ORF type:complete len:113 (+),score=4.56 TRINITY_DN4018_c0_g4_i3:187-525(+)